MDVYIGFAWRSCISPDSDCTRESWHVLYFSVETKKHDLAPCKELASCKSHISIVGLVNRVPPLPFWFYLENCWIPAFKPQAPYSTKYREPASWRSHISLLWLVNRIHTCLLQFSLWNYPVPALKSEKACSTTCSQPVGGAICLLISLLNRSNLALLIKLLNSSLEASRTLFHYLVPSMEPDSCKGVKICALLFGRS